MTEGTEDIPELWFASVDQYLGWHYDYLKFQQIWGFFVTAQNLLFLNKFVLNIENKHFKIKCSAAENTSARKLHKSQSIAQRLWNKHTHVNIGRLSKLCSVRKNTSKFTYILFKLGKRVGKHTTSTHQKKSSCLLVVVKTKMKTAFLRRRCHGDINTVFQLKPANFLITKPQFMLI